MQHAQSPISRRSRRGFTLIELLVVIAILGILVALLLPAVQAAREAARRVQCRNHLKQLGIAIHSYHESQGTFPPGGITMGHWEDRPSFTTWTVALLPFIEQENLFNRYDADRVNESPANAAVRESVLAVMNCPSDVHTGRSGRPETGPGNTLQYAVGSYRAVSGRSDGTGWWDVVNVLPRHWRGAMHHIGTGGLGCERFRDIRDGTSQTLLVGEYSTRECRGTSGTFGAVCRRATFWAYTYTSYNQSAVCPECGSRTRLPDFDACTAGFGAGNENACKRAFASFHRGGMHFLLCDGSVRFLSENINPQLLGSLATIAGREIVSEF